MKVTRRNEVSLAATHLAFGSTVEEQHAGSAVGTEAWARRQFFLVLLRVHVAKDVQDRRAVAPKRQVPPWEG